ncbi:prolyl oligopeptidase family serine peptidase [Lentisalinibacter salinarum]|uniref:prolyl oligopeptidase family serine peptidase n=1 Tax=Lentisalinibacter salinarum TaxID=2992239 RepID=UPI0038698E39
MKRFAARARTFSVWHRGTLASLLLLVVAPLAALAAKPPQYFVDESKLPFEALPGATAYWGVHTGAGYRIEVPENWNGTLVLWAHGFRGEGLELTVDNHPLREFLIPNGYAWAASSYRRNDYDVASGVQDTHALTKLFNGIVAKPDKVYIVGASMGGHVTAVAIEQYPKTYDGALPICGVMGDYEVFDYFFDFNIAAQQIGTGSSNFPVNPLVYLGITVPTIKANLEAFPGGWPAVLNADGQNFKNLVELRSGGDRPNFDEAWFFWNSFPEFASGPGNFLFDLGTTDGTLVRAPGVAVDNRDVVYQFDTDPALSPAEQNFNDSVFRQDADPQARKPNGLAQVPTVQGDPSIPVLTLHNLGDLFVPVLNQVEYAKRVQANGKSDLLVQRAIRGVNHCGFTGIELATAFSELVAWVEFGVKPAGDNFLDPAEVASPDFGCQFTDFSGTTGDHLLATPCD